MTCYILNRNDPKGEKVLLMEEFSNNIDRKFYNKLFELKGKSRFFSTGGDEQNKAFFYLRPPAVQLSANGCRRDTKSIFWVSDHPYGDVYILNQFY